MPNSKFMGSLGHLPRLQLAQGRRAAKARSSRHSHPSGSRPARAVKPIAATSPRPTGRALLRARRRDVGSPRLPGRNAIVADQLLAPSGKTADALQATIDSTVHPSSFDLPQSSVCLAKTYTDVETHKGRNVVALLEGSDPKLKAQTILVTAHHDHMGTSNGHIYHGADDNASGIAGLLAVARAMTESKVHPKRSVLFVAYDGEERIFLGSYFYVTHPVVPSEPDHRHAEPRHDRPQRRRHQLAHAARPQREHGQRARHPL